jgi:PAS domain S-box-containing protein
MVIFSIKDERFIEVNESFLQLTGFSREQVENARLWSTNFGIDVNNINRINEVIRKEGIIKNFEVKFKNKSADIKTVLFSAVVIWWNNMKCILGLCNDITEFESEMARLERLNLIGEIAVSIAHEIRNPMTTIRGYLQLFKSYERYREDLLQINLMIEELDHANAILKEFLALAKNKALYLKLDNLNSHIMNLLPLLQAEAREKDMHIKLDLQDIPDIMLDSTEINQLIVNLVRNGFEAMSARGCLTIKTRKEKNNITLIIQDQGPGMPPEVLKKIGTPFFTTKVYGTGLGLVVCYRIAERHNGKIEIETNSAGSIFKVIFPL